MENPLDWQHSIDKVPHAGLQQAREATSAERDALAAALDIVACERLAATFRIHPFKQEAYIVSGEATARIVQTCVVTLEPITQIVKAPYSIEFRYPEDLPVPDHREVDLESADDPEPIVERALDLGKVVYEHLLAAIDPYPRKDGVAFDWTDPKAVEDTAADAKAGRANPFAALAKLKPQGG